MKTLLPALLLASLLSNAAHADEAAPATMAEQLRASVPTYDPAIRAAEVKRLEAEKEFVVQVEEEVVTLPELTVQEKALRKMEDETLYRRGAWDKELVKRELSEFDRFFANRFKLPLFGISQEVRARELYLARKNREFASKVTDYADAIESADPVEAKALRVVMLNNARSGEPLASAARPSNWGR